MLPSHYVSIITTKLSSRRQISEHFYYLIIKCRSAYRSGTDQEEASRPRRTSACLRTCALSSCSSCGSAQPSQRLLKWNKLATKDNF